MRLFISIGAVVALCALGALTAFLIPVFAVFLDSWLAALLVGIMLAAVAATSVG